MAARALSSGRSQFIQLSPLSATLIGLCDGRRTVREITEAFELLGADVGAVAPAKACVFGLELLRQQNVLVAALTPTLVATSLR